MVTIVEVDKEYAVKKFDTPTHETFIGNGFYEINYKTESVVFVFTPINYLQVAHNAIMFMIYNRNTYKPVIKTLQDDKIEIRCVFNTAHLREAAKKLL